MCNPFTCEFYEKDVNGCMGQCRTSQECEECQDAISAYEERIAEDEFHNRYYFDSDGELPDELNSEEEFYKQHPECLNCEVSTGYECSQCKNYK